MPAARVPWSTHPCQGEGEAVSKGFLSTLSGSFSTPADDNPTVAMMEAAYAAAGLDARYLNCDVSSADLADAILGARAMDWVGFNCSMPHKVAVIDHLDGLGESAELIGAVNCVVVRDGGLIGENTDGRGFVEAVRELRHPCGTHVVVLGAGGAGRGPARMPSPPVPMSSSTPRQSDWVTPRPSSTSTSTV